MPEKGVEGQLFPGVKRKIAFVLSGGGNFGALQAGALEVLLGSGILPDIIVGTSAGALNAIFIAIDPSPNQARALCRIWEGVKPEDVGLSNNIAVIRRLVQRKPSFYDPKPLRGFLEKSLPPGVKVFRDLKIPAFTVAVKFSDGTLKVFGDDPGDLLLDGMLASSAIPLIFPHISTMGPLSWTGAPEQLTPEGCVGRGSG